MAFYLIIKTRVEVLIHIVEKTLRKHCEIDPSIVTECEITD
jgi:hypothetical protein